MEPAARDELHALAHAPTSAITVGPRTVDMGIGALSALSAVAESELTDDRSPMVTAVPAADAIPGLRRISRG